MDSLYEQLRSHGFRLTPRRKAMIGLFAGEQGALTPQEVQARLRPLVGSCGLPGVYRNLEVLASCGIVFRMVTFGGERRYAFCRARHPDEHHHHIVCVSCGRVGDVPGCSYRDGMVVNGFRLLSHVVQLDGLCETCARQTNITR